MSKKQKKSSVPAPNPEIQVGHIKLPGIKEWHRTVLLLLLLAIAIGYIFWQRNAVETNFIDTLR